MINFSDYTDFFIFLGGLLIIGGVIYFFLRHRLQNIFIAEQEAERIISEEEISRLKSPDQTLTHKILLPEAFKNIHLRLSPLSKILLAIIIGGFLLNQFLMWKTNSSGILDKLLNINISVTRK